MGFLLELNVGCTTVTEFVPLHNIPYIFLSPICSHTYPLTNSSPHQTSTETQSLSFLMPCSHKAELHSIFRCVFLFHLFHLDLLCSSSGPSVCRSPFLISCVFLFCFRSIGSLSHFPFLHRTTCHSLFSLVQRCGSLP